MKVFTKIAVALLAGLGLSAQIAYAHTQLSSSSPEDGTTIEAPKEITLTFSEAVRLTAISIVVGDEDKALEIDAADPATEFALPAPALEPGTYVVQWRALSADTHVISGEITFTVSS